MAHIPVLLNEVLEHLDPKPGENFIDCTVGEGGHALAIAKLTAPNGRLLGIDRDADMAERLRRNAERFPKLARQCKASFVVNCVDIFAYKHSECYSPTIIHIYLSIYHYIPLITCSQTNLSTI